MIASAPASMNASARLSASSPHPGRLLSLSALRRASDHELLRHRGGLAGPDLLAERRDAFELLLALVGMLELGPGACRTASSAPHRPCLRRSPGGRPCRRRRSEASSSRRPAEGHRVLGGEVEPSSDQPLVRCRVCPWRPIQLERSHRCAPRRRTARRSSRCSGRSTVPCEVRLRHHRGRAFPRRAPSRPARAGRRANPAERPKGFNPELYGALRKGSIENFRFS